MSDHQDENADSALLPEEHEAVFNGEDLPDWLADAERAYLTGQLSSLQAVATQFDAQLYVIKNVCKERRWVERRQRARNLAAIELEERVDREAVDKLVDTFAAIQGDVVQAGRLAAHIHKQQMVDVAKRQKEAQASGKRFTPPKVEKCYLEAVDRALALQPKRVDTDTEMDDLASLLNERRDDE
jgi:hypothetical protein